MIDFTWKIMQPDMREWRPKAHPRVGARYSHSIVPGGLEVMS